MSKVLLISGGSSGIGEACVLKFLSNGYQVINFDIKDNEILSQNNEYQYIYTDISSEKSIQDSLVNKVSVNSIDTLIISAGIHLSTNIENTTTDDLLKVVNINLLGAFWLIKHVISYMKEKGGAIITIGSDQYMIAKPNSSAYGMTKAALAQLTKSIALDYAKYNITANCIGAGTIETPLFHNAINKYVEKSGVDIHAVFNEENQLQPIGRIGKSIEIADFAYYLASDSARFITGAYMPIDGGYTTK